MTPSHPNIKSVNMNCVKQHAADFSGSLSSLSSFPASISSFPASLSISPFISASGGNTQSECKTQNEPSETPMFSSLGASGPSHSSCSEEAHISQKEESNGSEPSLSSFSSSSF